MADWVRRLLRTPEGLKMAYYSGSFSSMANLVASVTTALATEGFSINGSTVAVPSAGVVTLTAGTNEVWLRVGDSGAGAASGGAGTLVNPTPHRIAMAHPRTDWAVTFPGAYHLFVDATEVWCFARVNTDFYLWFGFGVSSVPGLSLSGLWVSASCGDVRSTDNYYGGISVSGEYQASPGYPQAPLPFWAHLGSSFPLANSFVKSGFNGEWDRSDVSCASAPFIRPMLDVAYSPNAWNSEATLVPIRVFSARPSGLWSLSLEAQNARHLRITNYAPEDIITVGPDRWMLFPWFRKNSAYNVNAFDGSTGNPQFHSGTFGVAIRYDGP